MNPDPLTRNWLQTMGFRVIGPGRFSRQVEHCTIVPEEFKDGWMLSVYEGAHKVVLSTEPQKEDVLSLIVMNERV